VLALQTVARCPLCGLDYATWEDENIGGSIRTAPEIKRMVVVLWGGPKRNWGMQRDLRSAMGVSVPPYQH